MALVFIGISECLICGRTIEKGQELYGTSGGVFDTDNELSRYFDAGMHLDCFLNWNRREEFVNTFNLSSRRRANPDGTYRFMHKDGSIVMSDDLDMFAD